MDNTRQPSAAPPIGYDPSHASSLMGPPAAGEVQPQDLNQGNTGSSISPAETTGNQGTKTVPPPGGAGSVTPTTRITHDRNTTASGRTSYSCAECKRLKLKCSRCVCRGCPREECLCIFAGQVVALYVVCQTWGGADLSEWSNDRWKGTSVSFRNFETPFRKAYVDSLLGRLILAETKELHERIADLEKALAVSHAKTAAEPHTLLTNTYLYSPRDPSSGKGSIGRKGKLPSRLGGSSKIGRRGRGDDEDDDEDRFTDDEAEISLGTLTIGANGEAQFVGASAGSSLLHVSLECFRFPCGTDEFAGGRTITFGKRNRLHFEKRTTNNPPPSSTITRNTIHPSRLGPRNPLSRRREPARRLSFYRRQRQQPLPHGTMGSLTRMGSRVSRWR